MKSFGVGRFVRDPEVEQVNGTSVCKFALAMNESRKNAAGERIEYTNYFDFVIWDKAADVIGKYCKKGSQIVINATARQEKWEDKEGNKKSRVVFRVNEFEFVGGRQNTESNSNSKPQEESKKTEPDPDGEVPF